MQISVGQTLLHRFVLYSYYFVEGGMSDLEMTYLNFFKLCCNLCLSKLTFRCKCWNLSSLFWGKRVCWAVMNMISSIVVLVLMNIVLFSLYDLRLKDYYHCITLLFERVRLYFVCFKTSLFNQLSGANLQVKIFLGSDVIHITILVFWQDRAETWGN